MAHYHARMNAAPACEFRFADTSHVGAIVALVESAYRGDSGRRGWTTESDLLDGQRTDTQAVLEVLEHPHSKMLLAERDDRLLATCHLEQRGKSAYFGMFAVDPGEQGSGLGKSMLAEAERIACEHWQCRTMRMTVIEQRNDLIGWYERRGYRRSGEYQPFPYGNERFGIPRRDDLRFELLLKDLTGATA